MARHGRQKTQKPKEGRKNVEVECFTDSVGDFAWQGANPFAASAPVEDQATTAQETAEVLSETNLDAAAVDSNEGPTASMFFTSGSTPPEDAAPAVTAVPTFNAGHDGVPNSSTRRKKVVVRRTNRTSNNDDRRDISGEDRNSNEENDIAMEDGEPTGAATDTSDAGGNAAAMHWKKAYKTRAATSAGCEDEGKTIVEDNDRSDGALAEENKTHPKGANSPGRDGALHGMTNVVEVADSPASAPAQAPRARPGMTAIERENFDLRVELAEEQADNDMLMNMVEDLKASHSLLTEKVAVLEETIVVTEQEARLEAAKASKAYDELKQERDTAVRQAQLLAAGFQAVCAEKGKLQVELADLKDYGRRVFNGDMTASFSEDNSMAWFEPSQKAMDAKVAGLRENPDFTWDDPGAPPEEDSDSCLATPPTRPDGQGDDGIADERPLPQTPMPPFEQPAAPTPAASPVINADGLHTPASPAALVRATPPPSPQAAQQPLPAPAGNETAGADAASKLPTGLRWYAQATIVMCVVMPPVCAIATGLAVGGASSWLCSKLRR